MANPFDRILKENFDKIFKLFAQLKGISIERSEDIKDKLQTTLEREADFLKKVLYENSTDDFILHIEFQAQYDKSIPKRLLLYRAILYHKYDLIVKQIIIFLGQKHSEIKGIEQENLKFDFHVIHINDISYRYFLESGIPEAIILTILGNLEDKAPDEIIKATLRALKDSVKEKTFIPKYLTQLQVLSNLRNLHLEVYQNIQKMPIGIDIDLSQDPMFKAATELGIEKGIEKGVIKLLISNLLSVQQISEIFELPLSKVLKIQEQLEKKSKKK